MTQQLELFPDNIRIERTDPEQNMHRFYRMRLQPDLFGGCSLLRQWGRVGTGGREMVQLFRDEGEAVGALVELYQAKQRHGYRIAG